MPTLGLEVHQQEVSWRACIVSGTPKKHLSVRCDKNVHHSVVPAEHLHPDTIEDDKSLYKKEML